MEVTVTASLENTTIAIRKRSYKVDVGGHSAFFGPTGKDSMDLTTDSRGPSPVFLMLVLVFLKDSLAASCKTYEAHKEQGQQQ